MAGAKTSINVLWAVDNLGFNGKIHGMGMFCLNVIPAFNKERFDVTVCILRKGDQLRQYVEERGIKRVRYLERGKYDLFTALDFFRILGEGEIDIMHLHGYGANNFGRVGKLFFNIPTIIHSHDPLTYYPWYQNLADLVLARFTDATVAVSSSVKRAVALKRGIPLENIEVLPTCIPLEHFKPLTREERNSVRERLGIPRDWRVIGTITRFHTQKGNEYLIEAIPIVLQEFPKTLCLMVGDGPLRDRLKAIAQKLGVEKNIIFTGYCRSVRPMLGILGVKILPSLWEGTPLTMLEAMAMGKPIVATNVDGMEEVLKDGRTALLVPPRDSGALAEKITYLLRKESEAQKLGLKARGESEQYDVSFCAKQLGKLYERLYASKRSQTT